MEKIKKKKSRKQEIFLLMAFVMFVITLLSAIYLVTSLGENIGETLKLPPINNQSAQFDIQGYQKLDLTQ